MNLGAVRKLVLHFQAGFGVLACHGPDTQGSGVTLVHLATGLARSTIRRGMTDLESGEMPALGRQRRVGAGRPRSELRQAGLKAALDALAEPTSRGDPESPLRWTCQGVRRLAAALGKQGFRVGRQKVSELLGDLGYSLQGNRKTQEGGTHPDRDAQFRQIARTTNAFLHAGDPVISVDTKKKELVGNYKGGGREWRLKRQPIEVKVHDFVDKTLGRAMTTSWAAKRMSSGLTSCRSFTRS
jgi:Rhodopirellula transposase DDE domain